MEYITNYITTLTTRRHAAAAGASFVALGAMNAALNASYAASNHPVAYAEGQTTFDGARIKGFYATMDQAGTLDIYTWTQILDFGFIAAVALVGICIGSLLRRVNRPGSRSAQAGRLMTIAALAGASFDALENVVSFVMLAQPQSFANWLAIPYSTFAVIKFGFISVAMIAMAVSFIGWLATGSRAAIASRRATTVVTPAL